MKEQLFELAKPVWLQGKTEEIHIRAQFRAVFRCEEEDVKKTVCRVATSGIYNLFVNGRFVAYGPARAGKNHFRMDAVSIAPFIKKGVNVIALEVAGYYVNSYYLQCQPSFVQAEVLCGERVVCHTGGTDFIARINPYAVRKVMRYSFQRPMMEAYRYGGEEDGFMCAPDYSGEVFPQEIVEDKKIIERLAPYPEYESVQAQPVSYGEARPGYQPEEIWKERASKSMGPKLRGFPLEACEWNVVEEVQRFQYIASPGMLAGEALPNHHYQIYELPYNATGMVDFEAECASEMDLYCMFDEVLSRGDVALPRMGCVNVVKYHLAPGKYHLKFFEVYTMKYMKFIASGSDCTVKNVRMVEYKHHPVQLSLPVLNGNEKLQKIAAAAVESYRQNAVDLFTDCPSRERAGWLCDSFFTGRVEKLLTGQSLIERSFLENFLHEESYAFLPEGMLPMCYPSDHDDGNFIPNWALWLVVELEEYLARSGDRMLVDAFKDKVYRLFQYFKSFENCDGLLENLEQWVFLEWSRANDLTQDVNYPSNMLYSGALRAAGRLYDDGVLLERAKQVKEKILEQSWNGAFFTDNAVRQNGALVFPNESTEVCQYYAFFFDIATPKSHPKLFHTLLEEFGPERKQTKHYPEVAFANAFIGNYLRLDILSRYGYHKEVLQNIEGYFYYMAEKTGTLWEHDGDYASCDHGFASHVLYWLNKMC